MFALGPAALVCEFFHIQYALGVPPTVCSSAKPNPCRKSSNAAIAVPSCCNAASQLPSSCSLLAATAPHLHKAEHTAAGTNQRFVITNTSGRALRFALHTLAYSLVNWFCLQLPPLGTDRNPPIQNRRPPDGPPHPHPSGYWLAISLSASRHRP